MTSSRLIARNSSSVAAIMVGMIGSLDDLQNATLEDVKTFYERWYGANNATLVVAGDFDPEQIKPQIEQWFGEMRRGPDVEHTGPMPVTLNETRKLWYPDNFAKLPELRMVFPTVEQYHPDSYPLDVLGRVRTGRSALMGHPVLDLIALN